jgi:predicted  nucleic acid-binding Zn-ribbon protein
LTWKSLCHCIQGEGKVEEIWFEEQREEIMKCPRCGYVSFDYNESCPKCDEDIRAERTKLNLSDYRSDPPFLLGALTGEVRESEPEISTDYDVDMQGSELQRDMDLVNAIEAARDETLLDKAEKITVVIDKKKGRTWAEA